MTSALDDLEDICKENLTAQFELLIQNALESVQEADISGLIFTVDALDECDTSGEVAHLLARLTELAYNKHSRESCSSTPANLIPYPLPR